MKEISMKAKVGVGAGQSLAGTVIFKRSNESRRASTPSFQYDGLKPFQTIQLINPAMPHNKPLIITTSVNRRRKIKVVGSLTRSRGPRRERDPKKRVVITGMGVVSVFGNEVDVFYDKLLDGVSGIVAIERFDASKFAVRFGGQIRNFRSEGYIDGEMDEQLDNCWRFCLVACNKALDDANLGKQVLLQTMDKTKMGALIGSSVGGLSVMSKALDAALQNKYHELSPFTIPYYLANTGGALLAMETGFMGPNYSISTACASSNHCFFAAANHIRQGHAQVMVSGGTDSVIVPIGVAGFAACRALSTRNHDPKRASRPWDKKRDGFVMGEGAGILVMESLEHALKRGAKNIYAEYLGGAVTCDAHHMTDPRPDGLGVSSCIAKSLQNAGVSPHEVNYINAHGTSTPAGDLVEVFAINKVFNDTSHIKMNATKSMIGHGLGAAGGMEAIATIKAINTGWLHPTINQYELEADVTIDTVPNIKKQHQVNVAISNSFGFGGQNSVAVFAPFKP